MITLILVLAVIGFLAYLVTTYIPMEPVIKTTLVVIVVICMVVYVLKMLGVGDIPVPKL